MDVLPPLLTPRLTVKPDLNPFKRKPTVTIPTLSSLNVLHTRDH